MNPRYQKALDCLAEIEEEGLIGKSLRPAQKKAIRAIVHQIYFNCKKYVVLTAPTGSGKSLIAAAIGIIAYKTNGWRTNLTTSNRALQIQYGNDLKVDPMFKVIMGNQNYRCSLFEEEHEKTGNIMNGVWSTCGNAPCQEWELPVLDFWYRAKQVSERGPNQIETIHEDQDWDVIKRVGQAVEEVNQLLKQVESMNSSVLKKEDGEEDTILTMQELKVACKDVGSCSFYKARDHAELSPIAIRSIQHMAFYIMFGVQEKGAPILQSRPLHIHDECHHIDQVFRELFSCEFTENYYMDTIAHCLENIKIEGLIGSFNDFKQTDSIAWNDAEIMDLTSKIVADLGHVLEATVIKSENILRGPKDAFKNAMDFLRAAADNRVLTNLDEINKYEKTVLKWYKNLTHANQDTLKYAAAKASNRTYDKKYSCTVGVREGVVYVKAFPITLEGMVKRYFGEEHTVFMSATPQIPKIFERLFGVVNEVGYVEVPSDFPPERSPIYWDPVDKITSERAKELGAPYVGGMPFKSEKSRLMATQIGNEILAAKLAEKIREIIRFYPKYTGIIPCPSYTLVRNLKECLEDVTRFIWVTQGDDNKAKIKEFKARAAAGEPVILVSAGIAEGHSFEDNISRLQIIPKMPQPAQSAEVMEINKKWSTYYSAQTAITLQQMVGRSMRSKDDYCITIVLDEKFSALQSETTQKLYSKHFLQCIRWKDNWKDFIEPLD